MWRLLPPLLAIAGLQQGCALIARPSYDAFLYSEPAMSCLLAARRGGVREAERERHAMPNAAIDRAQSRCRFDVPREQWHVFVRSSPDGATQFAVDTWPTGLPVRAQPKDGRWVEIALRDGRRGWVLFSQILLIATLD